MAPFLPTKVLSFRAYVSAYDISYQRTTNQSSFFLQAGGNDAETHTPALVIREYDALINEVKRHSPKSHITLCRIPRRRFDWRTNEAINKVNTFLEDRSKRDEGITFLDPCPAFPTHFRRDRVHLNRRGTEIYGNKIACAALNFQVSNQNQFR